MAGCGWMVATMCVLGTVLPLGAAPLLDEPFAGELSPAWKREVRAPGQESLTAGKPGEPGLRFASRGLDLLTRPCAVGPGAFEIVAELDLTGGTAQAWRNAGIIINLSSAPIEQMGARDWTIHFSAIQQGVTATARREGNRSIGRENPRRPGVWGFPGFEVAPRFGLTMAGAEGFDYSIRWPTRSLSGITLRFHAWRDSGHLLRFTVYNADGAAGPWWEGQVRLPQELQSAELKHLTIHTGREAADFADPARPVHGTPPAGVLRRIEVRPVVDDKPQLARSFPGAVRPANARSAQRQPVLVPRAGGLDALRNKFQDPQFADYQALILRNTMARVMDKIALATPAQNERVVAPLWSYVFSGDKAHLDRARAEIDLLIGVSDQLPAEQRLFPGRLRQMLDIQEFMCHNVAALAMAYDLLGDELDVPRRDRIRYLLVRAVKYYLWCVEHKDWWYTNNPSNTIGVANGSMGFCALVLREEEPELARPAIDKAISLIKERYQAVRPDGSCIEGNMYWNYGLSFPLFFGYALRNATGNDAGLLGSEGIRNAFRYMETNLGGADEMICFNDTQPWLNGMLVCARAGSEFDQPLMRFMADHMARQFVGDAASEQCRAFFAVSAFLHRDTRPAPREFPGVPNVSLLEGVQEGVMRSDGRQLVPALVTGVKGKGKFSTHHSQEDQGSFVLFAHGEQLLLDPGYFNGEATCHSLPLIGDTASLKLAPTASAPLSEAWESGVLRSMCVDATAAYNGKTALAQRVRRVFVQAGDQGLIVLDDVIPRDAATAITAQYQSAFAPEVKDGRHALITGRNGTLALRTFGPELKLEARPRTFRGRDWVYTWRKTAWHTLAGAYVVDADRPLVTVLVPAAAGKSPVGAEVRYAPNRIEVKMGEQTASFRKDEAGWHADKR